ncbi:hypothetical protein WEI85_09040 [Actinomycetes bacterium KLBMP 9797]
MTETVVTGVPPALAGVAAGQWRMRADRCFLEFTVWRWLLPVMRGRLPAIGGRLTVADEPRLRIDVDGSAVQGAAWMLLFESPYSRVRFRSTGVEPVGDQHLHIDGTVLLRQREVPLALRTRVIPVDGETLLIHATGGAPLAEVAPARSGLPRGGRVDVLLAAEFGR